MTMKGFTLIETLVAVSILTLSISGPLYTANRAIIAAENARNQLIASHLAQEGIEYVRWMRDNEFLAAYQASPTTAATVAWIDFLSGGSGASITRCRTTDPANPVTCTLDPASRNMCTASVNDGSCALCAGASCATPLYVANNIYTEQSNLSGAVKTPFVRTIQVVDISGTSDSPTLYPDKRIVSTVSWSYHSIPYTVMITDHLTPWQ